MKISTKGRYGLKALVDLAANECNEPISLSSVAARQNLSLNYMEQVFGILRKAGIVHSVKGPTGGYFLAKRPDDITVKEVLEVLEGSFSIIDGDRRKIQSDIIQSAIETLVWSEIDETVNHFLEERTIAQLVKEYVQLDSQSHILYYI